MKQSTLTAVLDQLRKTWAAQAARALSDDDLLQHFLANREDAAFTALAQRHGPMSKLSLLVIAIGAAGLAGSCRVGKEFTTTCCQHTNAACQN